MGPAQAADRRRIRILRAHARVLRALVRVEVAAVAEAVDRALAVAVAAAVADRDLIAAHLARVRLPVVAERRAAYRGDDREHAINIVNRIYYVVFLLTLTKPMPMHVSSTVLLSASGRILNTTPKHSFRSRKN